MNKEYQIVYDYNGHQISTMNGSDDWIPTKEIAEKLLARKQQKPYFKGEKLYLIERNNPTPYPEMQMYNGKPVYEYPYLYWDALDVGDYVSAEVAEWIGDCVPPIMYSRGLIQCGEPYDSALDKTINRHRPVYLTLRRVDNGVWEFIGYCFKGKTEDYRKGEDNI